MYGELVLLGGEVTVRERFKGTRGGSRPWCGSAPLGGTRSDGLPSPSLVDIVAATEWGWEEIYMRSTVSHST